MIPFDVKYWQYFVITLCLLAALVMCFRNTSQLIKGWKYPFIGVAVLVVGWLYIGLRPIEEVGDSKLYSTIYNLVAWHRWRDFDGAPSEWFWNSLEWGCLRRGITASGWFFAIAALYFLGHAVAVARWFPRNFTFALLFVISAVSFGGYAYNGLRHGLAAALCVAGLSLLPTKNRKRNIILIVVGWSVIVCGTASHTSMMLFAVAALAAYVWPKVNVAYWVWCVCLALSPFSNFFFQRIGMLQISAGRFQEYAAMIPGYSNTGTAGWRLDFIMYSSLPVLLAWYVTNKRKIHDSAYNLMVMTYLYANAAWLLIISIPFSNRFAYISWCLYPFLICYPLLKMRLCRHQGLVAGASMLFMLVLYVLI